MAYSSIHIAWFDCNLIILYFDLFPPGVELISPSKRIWATIIINCAYTVGDIFLGTVGYYFRYWRHFLLVIYLPGAFFISYFW